MMQLAQRFDVIAPEHPGFGRSETPPWLDGVGDLAYFYLDFIEALGLGPVHLVGASLGGWIAAEMGVRDTRALKSLVLAAPAGIRVKGAPAADIFLWPRDQLVRNLFADCGHAEDLQRAAPSEEEQELALRDAITHARLCWQPRLHNPDLDKWLHRIRAWTLVLWGDADKVIPPAHGHAYRDLIPGAVLETLASCGHLPHIERPDAFADAVIRFIEGIEP
jgi:pimeloyl-ACP methyl ester carboxylesterase